MCVFVSYGFISSLMTKAARCLNINIVLHLTFLRSTHTHTHTHIYIYNDTLKDDI